MTRPNRSKFRSIYLWHRYTGLIAAILLALLSISGILLQHAHNLSLDEHFIASPRLLAWYGLKPDTVTSYRTDKGWISHAGKTLYLNDEVLPGEYRDLAGALSLHNGIAVISNDELVLFSDGKELIDQQSPTDGLPEPPLGLAKSETGHLILRGRKTYWLGDRELLQWQPFAGPHPVWRVPDEAPPDLLVRIQKHNAEHRISWERLLMDLHSGRLFGMTGIVLADLAGIALLGLGVTGILTWLQRRRK